LMQTLYVNNKLDYSGSQFEPHWIYKNFKLESDSIVSFIGNADIPLENILKIKDQSGEVFTCSDLMLHFVIEHFDNNLDIAVYRKRLLIVSIKEELEKYGIRITRIGGDLYSNKRRLSIAIAISSTVSALLYTGINLDTRDEPVKTLGLKELGIKDIKSFAQNIMLSYRKELEGIYEERCKVRGVKFNN